MIGKYGSRKLLVGMFVVTIGTAITLYKGDIPANLLQLLEVIFGGFIVGNSISHIAQSRKPQPEPRFEDLPPPEELPPIIEQAPPQQIEPAPTQQIDLTPIMQGIITVQEMLALIIRKAGIDRMPDPK